MTTLAQIRADQTRCGDWLRAHAAWRDSDEMVETAYGRMKKRTAYAGFLAGAEDAVKEEVLWRVEVRAK